MFVFEYVAQHNMSEHIDQILEDSCLFKVTEAFAISECFLKKIPGKNAILKGIDFVKSFCKIKDKDILNRGTHMVAKQPFSGFGGTA